MIFPAVDVWIMIFPARFWSVCERRVVETTFLEVSVWEVSGEEKTEGMEHEGPSHDSPRQPLSSPSNPPSPPTQPTFSSPRKTQLNSLQLSWNHMRLHSPITSSPSLSPLCLHSLINRIPPPPHTPHKSDSSANSALASRFCHPR